MTFLGHRRVLAELSRDLPAVALLLGPRSVGKWTLACHLAEVHHIRPVDRLLAPDGVTAELARTIIAFAHRAPFGEVKLVQARLDGSSAAALNVLLKTLEEPPPTVRFLLIASTPVPATIASRAHRYHLGQLSDEQVRDILIRDGVAPGTATRAARLGHGQVRRALAATAGVDKDRAIVIDILRAIATGDRAAFHDRAFTHFSEATRTLLNTWLHEASTGKWAVFTPEDSFGLHRDQVRLRAMLLALSALHTTAPRLGVRAALDPFLPSA